MRAITDAGLTIEGCLEPVVDQAFTAAIRSEHVREAAEKSLTGLPLLLIWVLRRRE